MGGRRNPLPWRAEEDAALLEHLRYNRGRFDGKTCPNLPGRTHSACASRAFHLRPRLNSAGATPPPEPAIPVEWEEEQPPPPIGVPQDQALVEELVRMTKRGPVTIFQACDGLDLPPKRVRELVEEAGRRGYRVELAGSHVGQRPQNPHHGEHHDISVDAAGERRVIALVGDIHYGSKHHLGNYFQDFCRYAYERGARAFLHVGDLLDGVYRHSIWEQCARGYEEQAGLAVEQLPRRPGMKWYFIQGNHDETLGEASGIEVGRALEQTFRASGRDDLTYLGARGAYARLVAPGDQRGIFVELWHPRDKGNAYAKSYKMQKHIEAYAPATKPDVLAVGHWHQQMYFTTRGVHALSTGCWQGGQSSFGKSLSGSPDIGSWVVEYALTSGGTIRHLRPEWCGYYESETVRDISLG